MSGKQLIKLLEQHGRVLVGIKGAHHLMARQGFTNIVVPVRGSKDIKTGMPNALLKPAGLK